ncbi:MAG: hypothetical protein OFPI_44460 [Osedax symbiont Rs2]|nr:MAG: hypothetical protein OFPI_44460 [Osedax symbiont Rs2]
MFVRAAQRLYWLKLIAEIKYIVSCVVLQVPEVITAKC